VVGRCGAGRWRPARFCILIVRQRDA